MCAAQRLTHLALTLSCQSRDVARLHPAHLRDKLLQDGTIFVRVISQRRLRRIKTKDMNRILLHGVALGRAQQGRKLTTGPGTQVVRTQRLRVIVLSSQIHEYVRGRPGKP